jgi:hypothetical protein
VRDRKDRSAVSFVPPTFGRVFEYGEGLRAEAVGMMAVYKRGFIGGVAAAMVYLLTEVIRAVGLQTDLHDPVHRA